MSNSSATGGFLSLTPPQRQETLDNVLHDLIAGICDLPGELVRPRWQPDPPAVPERGVTWCAFGVQQFEPQNFPVIAHHGAGDGHGEIVGTEELQVLVSFYGPQYMDRAHLLRLGLHVPQNRAILRPAGLAFVRAGTIVPVPEQVALGWQPRADISIYLRLETRSSAATLNLKGCGGCGSFIETDTGVIASLQSARANKE